MRNVRTRGGRGFPLPEPDDRDPLAGSATPMRLQIDVVVRRGRIAESRHHIQAAVADPAGRLIAATAEASAVTTFRSAAKPFQLLPLVERGHAARWRLTDEELAIMSASHTGSPYHVAL